MNNALTLVRLSVMMFLQFFIWGSWYVTTGNFMAANGLGSYIGIAYSLVPVAALISPFFLGLIADRFFPSQMVLGLLHLLGGAFLFAVPLVLSDEATSATQWMFLGLLFCHALCYTPTLSLTNTVGFSNMTKPETEFPIIRVFGTIGWIVAGLVVGAWLQADKSELQYWIAGGASVALGLYCFTLPHTPPPARGRAIGLGELIGLDALKLLTRPAFAVFMVCSMLICIPLAAYYAFAQVFVDKIVTNNEAAQSITSSAAAWMTVGQMSEILFMLLIPLVFNRLGVKMMLLIGMAAWFVRYVLFSFADADNVFWMTLIGIALHGICYDFFFVTGFIYTEKTAKPEIRGQAQGLLVMMTQGVGLLIGAQISQVLFDSLTTEFKNELSTLAADGTAVVSMEVIKLTDWSTFWLINAAMALVVTVVFALTFWDRVGATDDTLPEAATAKPIDPATSHSPAEDAVVKSGPGDR